MKSKYFCTLVCVSENIDLLLFQENKEKFFVTTNLLCCRPWKLANDAIWNHAGFCKQMVKSYLFSWINNQIAYLNTIYMKFIFAVRWNDSGCKGIPSRDCCRKLHICLLLTSRLHEVITYDVIPNASFWFSKCTADNTTQHNTTQHNTTQHSHRMHQQPSAFSEFLSEGKRSPDRISVNTQQQQQQPQLCVRYVTLTVD